VAVASPEATASPYPRRSIPVDATAATAWRDIIFSGKIREKQK